MHHVVLICGAPGTGKTFFLQRLVELNSSARRRWVFFDLLGYWRPQRRRTVIRSGSPEEAARAAIEQAPCTLVIDECALAYPQPGWSPQRCPALNEVLKVGRQASAGGPWARPGPVSLLLTTQRPANVHVDVKSMLQRLYVGGFPSTAATDIRWIEDAVRQPMRDTICALPFGTFLPFRVQT